MSAQSFEFERYLNIRSAYTPAWLGGGRRVAFITDITGTPQVWAVDAGSGWPDQLSFFQDKVWAQNVSPAGSRLVCTRDVGGNERYQLFLISSDGVDVKRLTQDDNAMHVFGGWSHDGRRIAYSSNSRSGIHFDIYVQSVDEGAPEMVLQGDTNLRVLAWSPDDKQLLLSQEVSSAHQPLRLLDLVSGETRDLTPAGTSVSNRQARWPHKNHIYLLTDQGRDVLSLARLHVDSGKIEFLGDNAWDIDSLAVSPNGKTLAYTANQDGYAHLYFYDIESGQPVEVTSLPAGVVAEPVFSPDGSRVAVSVQSPQHNLDVWSVDVDSHACRRLTRSSLAGIPKSSLVAPALVRYETFDGRRIPAYFYRPINGQPPFPAIMYVHGGPASQIRPDFDPRFQFFLSRGYAILAPNVRGSTGYGKAYMGLDDVRLRMDSVADLKYGAAWLRDSGVVNPQRIAIYGRSYGGFMVLSAITTYPELWAAAIDVVGIGNWVTFLEKTGAWRRAHREQEYGSLTDDREFLESISPIHQIDRIQAPLLVVHGTNDPRVPVAEADQIVASLQRRDHPVEYLCYADEGHKISKLKNRIDSFTKMAEFLEKHL